MDYIINISLGFLGSGLFAFLFKEAIKQQFRKEVEKEIAVFSHDLQIKSEVLKNDLNKEIIKAQLMWSNIHEIYPALAEKLELAHGDLGHIVGLR